MSIKCKVCDDGEMKPRKRYRMSGIVVLIGYLFLLPSLLGMLIGVLAIVGTGKAVSAPTIVVLPPAIEKQMVDAGIPPATIAAVKNRDPLTAEKTSALTEDQRRLVTSANSTLQMQDAGETVGKGMVGAVGIGFGAVLIVMSFVGGLIGWLLVMKKKVLQCLSCDAVVAAG